LALPAAIAASSRLIRGGLLITVGRMTRRTEGADISEWAYDTAVNGVGKLVLEENADIERSYAYDALGRPMP
jgi:hypothetical protein